MLILEGPDLVGKTSTARLLLKTLLEKPGRYGAFPSILGAFSRLPPGWQYIKSFLPYINRYTIQDRFHLSDMCYGPVCRGVDPFSSEAAVRTLEAMLALVGSYTVLITASSEFLEWQWKTKVEGTGREEMFTLEQILKVNERYELLTSYHPAAVVDFHYRLDKCDDSGYLGQQAQLMDDILSEWSCRLNYVHALTGVFYESHSREVDEVRQVR